LGPDGQPLPPKPRRERKPIGPDANGLGPDGTPWDPERRGRRQAERRQQQMNAEQGHAVETASDPGDPGSTPPAPPHAPPASPPASDVVEAVKE
jgi:hypothetical protein